MPREVFGVWSQQGRVHERQRPLLTALYTTTRYHHIPGARGIIIELCLIINDLHVDLDTDCRPLVDQGLGNVLGFLSSLVGQQLDNQRLSCHRSVSPLQHAIAAWLQPDLREECFGRINIIGIIDHRVLVEAWSPWIQTTCPATQEWTFHDGLGYAVAVGCIAQCLSEAQVTEQGAKCGVALGVLNTDIQRIVELYQESENFWSPGNIEFGIRGISFGHTLGEAAWVLQVRVVAVACDSTQVAPNAAGAFAEGNFINVG